MGGGTGGLEELEPPLPPNFEVNRCSMSTSLMSTIHKNAQA